MEELFATGRIIDLICLLVAGEAVLLIVLARRRAWPARDITSLSATLAAGAALMLALRVALTTNMADGWITCAALLLVSLAAHVIDIRSRWR